jgi:CRISPR-associated exonuclease Cas4
VSELTTDHYLRINELKNYVYCPRITFYELCLDLNRATRLAELGIEAEKETKKRMRRRKHALHAITDGVRHLDVMVVSHAHRLIGKVDEVVETPAGLHVVDYKDTDRDYGYWKIQMQGYALCTAETLGRPILGTYIYIIPTQTYRPVKLTARDMKKLTTVIKCIETMLAQEICPPPTPHAGKCRTCQYRRFCNDVF